MNALNLKDASAIYFGTGSSRVGVASVWVGANKIWPAIAKPVITEIHFQYIQGVSSEDTGFYVSFLWPEVSGANEYWVYMNNVKVAELSSQGGGDMGYEYGTYNYGTTVTVQIMARGANAGTSMSDPATITISYPAFTGTTYNFNIIPSKTNVYGWTTGDNVKIYACFSSWPNSSQLTQFQSRYGQDLPYSNVITNIEFGNSSSAEEYSGMWILTPQAMDSVSVYPATITSIDGTSTSYSNVILMDEPVLGINPTGYTLYTTVIDQYSSWRYTDGGTKYRMFMSGAIGGEESEMGTT